MKVTIKKLNGETFTIELMKGATVLGLKMMISDILNIMIDRQRLIFRAQELTNNEALVSQYGIVDGSTVHIVIRNIDAPPIDQNIIANNVIVNIPNENPEVEGAINENSHNGQRRLYNNTVYNVLRLSRFIKIMSILNGIFLFFYIFSVSPYLIILCLLSIAGYIGAKYLRRAFLILYIVCIILDIGLRILLIDLYRADTINMVLLLLMILIDLFLFKCTWQLCRVISSLSNEERNFIVSNSAGCF